MSKVVSFPSRPYKAATGLSAFAIAETSSTNLADRAAHTEAVASAIAAKADAGDVGPVLDVAQLVSLVLRTCRRLGHKPSRLSPILAADLERHCALGDPTAQLLKDWLANKSAPPAIPESIAAVEAVIDLAGER